ncbi:caspase-8 [Archocentrus centrarchus]|uniref:caspase-8 n=1 Tax=Archocentrus centrarchus TaxID=63155 RepID=UPI0011E9FEB6|nr:caspase-8-like [Archocentrus centrarchus]XP_030614184.1 caspase-8-like [Archocentrus centrarchus]
MDFQTLLLNISKALSKDEVKAWVFLCTDLLGQKSQSVETASELFSCLMKQDYLSPENPQLLTDLLLTIERHALVRDLGLKPYTARSLISPYRKLLYSLSEDITDSELREVKFLLEKMLPRRKREEHITTLEVFLEMERKDLLSESDLRKLEFIIGEVCPMLNNKINQFKALRVGTDATSAQENKAPSDMPMSRATSIEDLGTYPMTSEKRGICLIVNNYDFSKSTVPLKLRGGTDVDEKRLESVFQWLGFEVENHHDCDGNKMLSVFRELSRRDHSQMDCVVCCVLSHGVEGSVYGVDGSSVKISCLTDPFNGLKCPSLAGKPKLFFIQACQGINEQNAVYIESDSPAYSFLCSDAVATKDGIPSSADFLLGMATVPSFVSFRDKIRGTWFIQSLCQNLVQMVPRECDLMSVLTKVNADVSQKSDESGRRKQMPQPAFSLRKKVVFPIPKVPPPSL